MSEETYRPSASLILAARQQTTTHTDDYDYNLLLIKRTAATAYTQEHCVFPGGVFDAAADDCLPWLHYFRAFGVTDAQLQQLHIPSNNRPAPLFSDGVCYSRDISLRLTALRETFEEVGLLLCCQRSELGQLQCGQTAQVWSGADNDIDLNAWQQAVHNDGRKFLSLCQRLCVVPDLWALSEWSVWRSTTTAIKKYDTVFYFAALQAQPVQLLLEPSEVESAYWLTPSACLQRHEVQSIWLAVSLVYEIARMTHMHKWYELASFAGTRNHHGSTLLMPVFYRCDECLIGTLPGDDLYPARPETYTDTIVLQGAYEPVKNSHRMLIYNKHDYVIENNIPAIDAHLRPLLAIKKLAKL